MRTNSTLRVLMVILLTVLAGQAFAQDPVKWSAPMSAYPNPWVPSQPPPSYANQYGGQYPYGAAWPGYGQAGYQPYGNNAQGWSQQNPQNAQNPQAPPSPQNPQSGFSGNPYLYR